MSTTSNTDTAGAAATDEAPVQLNRPRPVPKPGTWISAAVVTVLDPERVIVSGGLARSGDLWWGPLRETVRAEVVGLVADDLELVPAALGTTAPIVGAAHQARLRLLSRRAAGL